MPQEMSFAEMVDRSTGPEGEALMDQMDPDRAQRRKAFEDRLANTSDEEFFANLERIEEGNPYVQEMIAAYKKLKAPQEDVPTESPPHS